MPLENKYETTNRSKVKQIYKQRRASGKSDHFKFKTPTSTYKRVYYKLFSTLSSRLPSLYILHTSLNLMPLISDGSGASAGLNSFIKWPTYKIPRLV